MSESLFEFVTLVKIRPGAGQFRSKTGGFDPRAWQTLKDAFERIGAHVSVVKNVLGNDYDVLILGEAGSPKTLHQIDATCKAHGYEASTHPAIDAIEYAELAEATEHMLDLAPQTQN